MSKYGLGYVMTFLNKELQSVVTTFYDRSLVVADDAEQILYQMTPAGDPFHLTSINNGEDKFDQPIRAIQAIYKFNSDSVFNLSTFADAPIPGGGTDPGDPRWYVESYINDSDKYIFKGFVVLDDCQEDFMPTPNVVTLTATDNLGILKNIPLTDFDSETPHGDKFIIEFLSWALSKTGLSLNLNVVFNLRDSDNDTDHLFDIGKLDPRTFENTIGSCENCYQVIEKILGEMAFLTQRCGEWWIYRIDEITGLFVYRTIFTPLGVFQENIGAASYNKEIELTGDIFFSQEQTTVKLNRDHKFVKETYNFEYPKEIVCNIDFSRGDLNDDVSPTEKHYDLDEWTLERNLPASGSPTCITYIQRNFDGNDYETDRFAVITNPSNTPSFEYIRSCDVPISIQDKFDFSIDYKWSANNGSAPITVTIARILLYGSDGSFWNIDIDGKWFQSNSTWSVNAKDLESSWDMGDVDETLWRTLSTSAEPAPIGGNLRILLFAMNQQSGTSDDDVDIYYQNLIFDYIPLVNGSYRKYSGLYSKVSRPEDRKASRERQVYISDGIKPIFKGALKRADGTLMNSFFDWAVVQGTPTSDEIHPYGWFQVQDVWNQHRNIMRFFRGTMQGLQSDELDTFFQANIPSLIHRYYLQDVTKHSTNRYFMLLSFDIDLFLCGWTGDLAEVYSVQLGKNYGDDYEARFIS